MNKTQLIIVFVNTASLKPKWVLVKVPRKGVLEIEMGRYEDSKNIFCQIVGALSLLFQIENYFFA